MTFLPIVERELRVAARQSGNHWIRLSAALVALLIGGWIMLVSPRQAPHILSMTLFVSLSIFSYVYCVLAGLRTTADCLSEERREGTLGLLFLTDLKGYDVVLGKLAATSLNALYGLLAVVPVMAIPLLLGGVAVAEFWRVVLSSLATLLFSLTVGLFVSAISKDERRAMFATLLIVLLFVVGLPLAGLLVTAWLDLRSPPPLFFVPSPGYLFFCSFDEPYQMLMRDKFNFFHSSFLSVQVLSWGFFWLACLIVPRSWRDRATSAAGIRRRQAWEQIKHGAGTYRKDRRSHMLSKNPVFWLAARDRLRPVLVWFVLGLGALLWCWGLVKEPRDWLSEPAYIITALAAHTVLKLWMASEGGRLFAQDRRSGALELLLSTPLRVKEIIRGQMMSLHRQFFGPVVLILCIDLLFLLAERQGRGWVLLWLAGMGIFAADMVTLAWLSTWLGLSTAKVGRATATTVFWIMGLPWIVFLGCMALVEMSRVLRDLIRAVSRFDTEAVIVFWVFLGLVTDLGFGLVARHRLLTRFRKVAAERAKKKFRIDLFPSRQGSLSEPGQADAPAPST